MIKHIVASLAIGTLLAAPAASWAQARTAQEDANLKTVLAFYEAGLNQKDADAALKYVGERYIQHNPFAEDGPEGFRKFIGFLRSVAPNARAEIKKSFVDGDHVILHVFAPGPPGTKGNAVIDIFRLEKGKIVEHWDTFQAIPETAANANTMF